MEGLRVLLVNDFYEGGGAEGVFRETYRILKEGGVEVRSFYGSEKHTYPKTIFNYFYSREFALRLEEEIVVFKPTIIHIHNYYHILTSAIFSVFKKHKSKKGFKVILTLHDYHFISPSSHLLYYRNKQVLPFQIEKSIYNQFFQRIDERGILYSLVKKLLWLFERLYTKPLKNIDTFISPSNFLILLFKSNGVLKPQVLVRNPLQIDIDNANNILLKAKKEKELRFVYFGRVSPEKGISETISVLLTLNSKIIIDIIGIGPCLDEYKSLFKDYCNIRFLGSMRHSELMTKIKRYDVALVPSLGFENAPLVIVEAAQAGLTIFASDMGGIREICLECNVPHFLFNPVSFHEIKKQYNNLLLFYQKDQFYNLSLSQFSPSSYFNSLMSVYHE